jgi:hypothetical protein
MNMTFLDDGAGGFGGGLFDGSTQSEQASADQPHQQ